MPHSFFYGDHFPHKMKIAVIQNLSQGAAFYMNAFSAGILIAGSLHRRSQPFYMDISCDPNEHAYR